MQRLADLEHDEVRDIDEIADRALPRQRKPDAHAGLGGAHAHVCNALSHETMAIAALDRDVEIAAFLADDGRVGLAHLPAEGRAELACETEHRHDVDAVRGDLDFQDVLIEAKELDDVGADRRSGIELHDAVFEPIFLEAELEAGDEHPLGIDAAHLARRDPKAARSSASIVATGTICPGATFVAAV